MPLANSRRTESALCACISRPRPPPRPRAKPGQGGQHNARQARHVRERRSVCHPSQHMPRKGDDQLCALPPRTLTPKANAALRRVTTTPGRGELPTHNPRRATHPPHTPPSEMRPSLVARSPWGNEQNHRHAPQGWHEACLGGHTWASPQSKRDERLGKWTGHAKHEHLPSLQEAHPTKPRSVMQGPRAKPRERT